MASTETKVLTVALILSLGLNVYELLNQFPHCNDTDRYGEKEDDLGGLGVTDEWAYNHVSAYRTEHARDESIYKTTGFMFSKKALDKIFDATTVNTLTIDLIENDKNELAIVIKGVTTNNTNINTNESSTVFLDQTMCPNDCADYR